MSIVFNADEIFSMGVQIEKNGQLFYKTAAARTSEPQIAKLFSTLADWESKHVKTFEELRGQVKDHNEEENLYDPDNIIHQYLKAAASQYVFVDENSIVEKATACTSTSEALSMAISFEKDSVVYYSSMKEMVRGDLGKEHIDKLIREELSHIGQLNEELSKLKENNR
ncbi:ferritin family protein [Chitinispirillales bacterium ANBcel5]|uniref:ferritin-like domain-containing protein n=1 Tax=Cellulosispirillum alkaliphilum TaxID=3039283 RepID=UPI002A57DA7D|nr:ferritin family protein [Chitinispirillales bacterium ANBcel5]